MKRQTIRFARRIHDRPVLRGLAYACVMIALFSAMGMSGASCGTNPTTGGNTDPTIIGTGNTSNNGSNGGTTGGTNPAILASDHVVGSANATVTVIEYADFQCPFCGRFARDEYAAVKSNYIDTGKIRWVFRHFPLTTIHNRAMPAAVASECAADQVDFYAYEELTYSNVDANSATILTDSQLQQNASNLGANLATFTSCSAGSGKNARIQQDVSSGTSLGVTGTPTFFVNDEKVTGFKTAAQLGAIIDQHLGG